MLNMKKKSLLHSIYIAKDDPEGEKEEKHERRVFLLVADGGGGTERVGWSAGNFIKFVISLRNRVKGAPLFRDKLAPH